MAGILAFLREWYTLLLVCGTVLTLMIWYIAHFHAMAPRKGTLEWIAHTELPRMTLPSVCPLRGWGWPVLLLAALLGAADCLLRMDAVYPASLIYAAAPAAASAAFCLLLLHLTGRPLSAFCTTLLFLAATVPDLPLAAVLIALWLLTLALMKQHTALRLLCLLLGLCAATAALYVCGYLVFDGAGIALYAPTFHLPVLWDLNPIPLLTGTAIVIALIQAVRLHRGDLLLAALLGTVCIALSLFSLPALAYAGCLTALAGTFAASEARGTSPLPVAILLLSYIILSSI